jgi:anaerobic magnesium-protoporphyrin IX monomethyl ester cyclase
MGGPRAAGGIERDCQGQSVAPDTWLRKTVRPSEYPVKVALVNTNRYLSPPVIPIGLEYLVSPLESAGHSVDVCDLSFSENRQGDLAAFLGSSDPDVIGFSVRNVDTSVYGNNVFFLEDVKRLIASVKEHANVPTVAGGSSTLCSREPLREYLGVDYLLCGPGEKAFPELLNAVGAGREAPRVIDGWASGIDPGLVHKRATLVYYKPYLEGGNPAGLEFRKGCDWECPFCTERKRPVLAREIGAVVEEARALTEAGAGKIFICDSEVNADLDRTNSLFKAFVDEELDVEWTGYFRPAPFDRDMARLAASSGCRTLTLSVNSWDLSQEGSPYGAADVSLFCESFEDEGIRVAVDLLIGYPGEGRDSVERALELLRESGPATVGVNPYIRLFEGTPVSLIATTNPAGGRLVGRTADNPGMLKPVFYTNIDEEWLKERISGEALFVLEGTEETVNYQRI